MNCSFPTNNLTNAQNDYKTNRVLRQRLQTYNLFTFAELQSTSQCSIHAACSTKFSSHQFHHWPHLSHHWPHLSQHWPHLSQHWPHLSNHWPHLSQQSKRFTKIQSTIDWSISEFSTVFFHRKTKQFKHQDSKQ